MSRATILPSKRSDHRTPLWFLEEIEKFFGGVIDLDPCASSDPSHWFALENYTREMNGLVRAWNGKVYSNPPFGRPLNQWLRKARNERREGTEIVMLHPAFTGRAIWQTVASRSDGICFLKGRLTFIGSKHGAAFNSQLTYFGTRAQKFRESFKRLGRIWIPDKD